MKPEWLEDSIIFETTTGSRLHGLDTPDSDHDSMGVCIEPMDQHVCLGKPWDNYTEETDKGDRTIYSLKKFLGLALKGNPTILEVLHAPHNVHIKNVATKWGHVIGLMDDLKSQHAGAAFEGYMHQQIQRLKGEIGQKDIKRADLVLKHGYDTKYAMHIWRLGAEGIDYMLDGTISLPLSSSHREACRNIRDGGVPYETFIEAAADLKAVLGRSREHSTLPKEPNTRKVEQVMLDLYKYQWSGGLFE